MNADELFKRVIDNGADAEGIRDRFGTNEALYADCFLEFLEEPYFTALKEALAEGDYVRAFDAAHALKGLSANLGLTAFYGAVCALVESLRAGQNERAGEQYALICARREELLQVIGAPHAPAPAPSHKRPAFDAPAPQAESAPAPAVPAAEAPAPAVFLRPAPSAPRAASPRRRMLWLLALGAAIVLVAGYLFSKTYLDYRHTVVQESGLHLNEMSNQIKLYVEEQVDNDWKVALSMADSLTSGAFGEDDALLDMMRRKRAVWNVSNLMLYTEDGYCVYANGGTEANDIASDTIVRARQAGRYMSVIDSTIIYTVPVDTALRYNGSRIAAVSVVQDMKTFLDDMNFSSFDGRAWMYLTEENGVIISALTNPSAVPAFNFKAIVRGRDILPLEEGMTADELFTATGSAAFLLSGGGTSEYVVSVPIVTGGMPLRVYYLAPEAVVNDTMNDFSAQLLAFSITMISLVAVMSFLVFLLLYRERKNLFNRALRARERMFDLLAKNTKTAFILFAADGTAPSYVSANAESVIGSRFWTFEKAARGYRARGAEGEDSPVLRRANDALQSWDGKSVFHSGYILNDQAAPPAYFEFSLYPSSEGGDTDCVGIAQDVTLAYEREEVTKNAMEMATRANEAKSRFLSNMSHDIRTPMNAIMNMTNFALESIDQPKKLGVYLHTIRESSEHLLHLINDVLDMSRIESGQTVITSAPFDMRAEIQRQVDMIRPLCEAKGQTLLADFEGLRTRMVNGDALKLAQIIMNLLSNAVKFTPDKGAVRFTAREIPSLREDMVDVRFVVEDNGIGISRDEMERIFAPFSRSRDKRVRHIEGTGLGLSICKSYVDAMGGTIKCESEEGEGSTFTVELFFGRAEAVKEESEDPTALGDAPFLGMRCLVAEDNAINQVIARTLLERVGFLADFTEDGRECLQKFLSEKPDAYDVIYLDIQMPVLDGYETAAQIRASAHPRAQSVPIVAMTANAFAEDIERARVAGMDAYVGKPIISMDLIEQTRRALKARKE